MKHPCIPFIRRLSRRQGGFSLVELMISIVLALLIVTGMGSVYLSVSRTNAEMAKTNDVIENGRIATDLMAEDLAHAGFWGKWAPDFDNFNATTVPTDVPTAIPDPCLAFDAANWTDAFKLNLLGIAVQGLDVAPGTCAALLVNKAPNTVIPTDVLVVRRVNNCNPGVGNCEALNTSKVYMQPSNCASEIAASHKFVLDTTGHTLTKRDCATLESRWKFIQNLYYIRSYAATVGDGIPTLMKSTFDVLAGTPTQASPQAMVEGIEGFAVEWGVDAQGRCYDAAIRPTAVADYTKAPTRVDPASCTANTTHPEFNVVPLYRGDGVPDTDFVRCTTVAPCTAAQLMNVVAARIYVLARSREATPGYSDTKIYKLAGTNYGPFNDAYRRHVYQMTVRLNNVAGRRETPP